MNPLPALRQDLALHPGPQGLDGAPTWTLHDPACNRFYRLSWPAFELLSRWGLGTAEAVIGAVNRETTLRVGGEELDGLLRMLASSHLLVAHGPQDTQRLADQARARRLQPAQWLLHNYLFFRIPLLRPMAWLQRMAPWVGFAFRPGFWLAMAAAALLGLVLVSRRWDEFTHTFIAHADWSGALAIGAALALAKVLHEFGHAFAAHRFGCRVPSMGVAFLVMWPVLYTDTNEAWKLTSRRERMAIGAAGMATELALAAMATLAWALLPDTPGWAPVRSGLFLLATTSWVLTLAINASPFMRFDGYFLLSDALNMPNLHERSFALARWWLRERLFGWGDAAPEIVSTRRRRFLIGFAVATWVYRLVLFLGIALLVYHLFFKALGLLLMAVEVGWFIVRPVAVEMRTWWQRRGDLRWNRTLRRTVLIGGAGLLVLLWPWQTTVRAPAVLGALQSQALHAPYPAQLRSAAPKPGQVVKAGQLLLDLRSPDLASRLALAQARERQLQWQLEQQSFDERLMEAGPALRKRWEAAVEEVAGLQREIQRLALPVPFDGVVVDVAEGLQPGAWVSPRERLMQVVSMRGAKVDAYVDESSLADLGAHRRGVFVPDSAERGRVVCELTNVDAVQLSSLDTPAVASPHGGGVPAQRAPDGRLVPLQPTFRVRLERCDMANAPRSEHAGVVLMEGERRSLAGQAMRHMVAVWNRESAF